ncbi:uncharacterized protein L969DRAFT_20141 [Mixia osmundae IAM 14324]|uniref:General negative regulator of transcription subunit n=1 Tax=Mixia osmundae (strain CBS 9802 / IAM 14324 / JCM 22182 / KY 12970) TaxID=764103 RepID=G7E1T8_MIXOS|nr:uncharacterized protein L969DRAFT_20141 [Mixia osmundae IAM 14324]KEI36746.1 hypothetical protein L969DRAFT_20141 [Mixia osmundae IAM 14324]GAA96798.1 hypothetical protein E5Q_03470 [Mixia osmundae IAM 14324]
MAARKLQTEIDKTLKKVTEGVEIFEGIYDKMQMANNVAQKEKLEADLKTQIKKLQRLRDQIKTWLSSNDIKDKKPLTDTRKLIETQMERFKACEKEMKTKAYSKEGLNAATKLDPKEAAKMETASWISNMVDELGRQVEVSEAEAESLAGGLKKKKDTRTAERVAELEHLNDRRNWHVSRLELILRLLENGNMEPDKVNSVKEDISYFVESNTEEDFEEDEGIYDDLDLNDQEEAFGIVNDDNFSSHDTGSLVDASESSARTPGKDVKTSRASVEPVAEDGSKSPIASKAKPGVPVRKATLEGATRPAIATGSAKVSSSSSAPSAPAQRAAPAALPPIRYSAAAAGAVVPPAAPTPTTPNAPVNAVSVPPATPAAPPKSEPPVTAPVAVEPPKPIAIREAAPSPPALPVASPIKSSAPQTQSIAASVPLASPPQQKSIALPTPPPGLDQSAPAPEPERSPSPREATSAPPASAMLRPPSVQAISQPPASTPNPSEQRLPSSLVDLVNTFDSAKQKSQRRDNDPSQMQQILDAGYSNVPQPQDSERPQYYVPKNPYPTPAYYPQTPARFDNPAFFARLDTETLFYVFYYHPGTYMQYLAGEALKNQSWRFHKQYLTWFQRANEPTVVTDDYESGAYFYFDWEKLWEQRSKSGFMFHYQYLVE